MRSKSKSDASCMPPHLVAEPAVERGRVAIYNAEWARTQHRARSIPRKPRHGLAQRLTRRTAPSYRLTRFVFIRGLRTDHLVELIAPIGLFAPRRVRHVAVGVMIAFQLLLIVRGNLVPELADVRSVRRVRR
jgi:hypothetical protein